MKSPWGIEKFAIESLNHVDNKFFQGTKQEVDYIERKLNLTRGDKVLDLGCGAGRHSIELALRGYQIDGIDISETMLSAAEKRAIEAGVKINFIQKDLSELHTIFNEESLFKGAICLCESGIGVLGEEKDFEFIKTVYQLLVPCGRFIVTSFNGLRRYMKSRDINEKFDYINGVFHWSREYGDNERLVEDQRLYIPSELKMLYRLAGFRDIEIYGCSPGHFHEEKLGFEDIEFMIIGTKPGADKIS